MRVVGVGVVTIDLADLLQLAIDHASEQGQAAMTQAQVSEGEAKECARAYSTALLRLAKDIERAGERFDETVLAHLDGPCKAH